MRTLPKTFWLHVVWTYCLMFALIGCSRVSAAPTVTVAPTPTVETDQLIVTDNFEGIIFSQASAEQMGLQPMLGDKISGFWTPSRDEVLAFEEQLAPYLQHAAPQSYPGPLRDLNQYWRQYVGILVNEQPVIFTNFFCNAHGTDWQHQFVFILDGGSCYFEIKYDVQTGAVYDLSIHGES